MSKSIEVQMAETQITAHKVQTLLALAGVFPHIQNDSAVKNYVATVARKLASDINFD